MHRAFPAPRWRPASAGPGEVPDRREGSSRPTARRERFSSQDRVSSGTPPASDCSMDDVSSDAEVAAQPTTAAAPARTLPDRLADLERLLGLCEIQSRRSGAPLPL